MRSTLKVGSIRLAEEIDFREKEIKSFCSLHKLRKYINDKGLFEEVIDKMAKKIKSDIELDYIFDEESFIQSKVTPENFIYNCLTASMYGDWDSIDLR